MSTRTCIAFLCLLTLAMAQSERFNKASYVTVQPATQVRITKAKSAKALVRFRVNKGFHVNSNQPMSDLLIPTEIKLESHAAVVSGKPIYPKGEEIALAFSPKQKLSVYEGDVAIEVPLSAAKTAKKGAYTLKGSLSYQACNDNACFPPKTTPFELSVLVE
jgi:hypothetical protein